MSATPRANLSPLPVRARIAARAAMAMVALTLVQIAFGSLVRAHGAGLACPDWPLCFGELIPVFDFRVAYEWGHRLYAGGISFGLVGVTVLLFLSAELRRRVAGALGAAWGLLLVQIVLGGLTVLLLLAPWTVTAHLIIGIAFCASLAWMAADLYDVARPAARPEAPRAGVVLALTAAVLLLAQLVLGGLVSSRFAGLACASFPTCDGVSFVPSFSGQQGIHVLHRLTAYSLLGLYTALALTLRGVGRAGRLAALALGLVLLQIGLGVANVLLLLPPEITAPHTLNAAALALITVLLLRELRLARDAAWDATPLEPAASLGATR